MTLAVDCVIGCSLHRCVSLLSVGDVRTRSSSTAATSTSVSTRSRSACSPSTPTPPCSTVTRRCPKSYTCSTTSVSLRAAPAISATLAGPCRLTQPPPLKHCCCAFMKKKTMADVTARNISVCKAARQHCCICTMLECTRICHSLHGIFANVAIGAVLIAVALYVQPLILSTRHPN